MILVHVPTYLRHCFRNVLSFVCQACDFEICLLNFVFYVLCFGFCVSCVRLLSFVFHVLMFGEFRSVH